MMQKKTIYRQRRLSQRWMFGLMIAVVFYFAHNFSTKVLSAQAQTASPSGSNKTSLSAKSSPVPNSDGFADLIEKLSPAVVNIRSLQTENIKNGADNIPPEFQELFRRFGYTPPTNNDNSGGDKSQKRTIAGIGSGFIISNDGLIVTNNHVIQNATEVRVTLSTDRNYVAKVIGKDDRTDIALLKINGKNLPYVSFGNSDKLRVGHWVIAIGNPIGLGGSVSAGIVSALGRNINAGQYDDFIQTDAAINRGNSGGPLFNTKGEVVGINSIIYSETGGNIGIGFAIPANQAIDVIKQIKRYGAPRRSWMGVALQEVDDDLAKEFALDDSRPRGALIVGVIDKSPAAASGLKVGDIILKIDNQEIKKSQNLPRIVANEKSGKAVPLTIWRNKQLINKNIVLSLLNRSQDDINKSAMTMFKKIQGGGVVIDNLGFAIRNVTTNDRAILYLPDNMSGVIISAFTSNVDRNKGDNLASDVTVGTLILSIDNQPATNAELVAAQLKKLIISKKRFPMFIFIPGSGFALVKIDPTQN